VNEDEKEDSLEDDFREMEEEDKEYEDINELDIPHEWKGEPSEPEETLEEAEKRLKVENGLRRAKLFNRIEKSLDRQDISEAEQQDLTSFSKLPNELQSQFESRVEKAINEELTNIVSQLQTIRLKFEAELIKRAQEAQNKIDAKLESALKLIDKHLVGGDNSNYIKEFAQILAQMTVDPMKNASWVVRLFVTEDGIKIVWENSTEEK